MQEKEIQTQKRLYACIVHIHAMEYCMCILYSCHSQTTPILFIQILDRSLATHHNARESEVKTHLFIYNNNPASPHTLTVQPMAPPQNSKRRHTQRQHAVQKVNAPYDSGARCEKPLTNAGRNTTHQSDNNNNKSQKPQCMAFSKRFLLPTTLTDVFFIGQPV